MAKSTAKAIAIVRDLKERLELRINGSASIDTIREAFDANGWPMLFLSDGGTETAGSPVIFLRVRGTDAVSKDIFGNGNFSFAPHELDFAYELDGTEGEPSRTDIMTVLFETTKVGMKTLIKEIADATAVTATNVDAAAVAKSLEFVTEWPTKGV